VVFSPDRLAESVNQARREALKVYGNERLYLERAIAPSHYIAVQIMADKQGSLIHLGEREGSILKNNQNLLEESPAPCLNHEQRQRIWQSALEIAELFDYRNVGAVEFLVDGAGKFYFTEIKARIQVEHPVSELVSGIDIVREQIRIAAGYPLSVTQEGVTLRGAAMQCRINAEDPWNNYLPSPGRLEQFRLPAAPNIRVDTYGYPGYRVPVRYDSLLANLVAWGSERNECIIRLQQALDEFAVRGVRTNIPLHLGILNSPAFQDGLYDTGLMGRIRLGGADLDERTRSDLAVAAAVAYVLRNQAGRPTQPERTLGGWHRSSRQLPT
jgi:acetyl/propionyl-CoA carboxylase alpha subunit